MSYYDILLAKQLSGGGGGGDITVESLSVTENGTYSAPTGKAYSPVVANVPNSYSASDEGKVVSSGALVAQTSQTIDTNGTYDTTLKNSVTVNVSGGGSGGITVDEIAMKTLSGTISGSASYIASSAFASFADLNSVAFPNCTKIYGGAFTSCKSLTTISFPTCTEVQPSAFNYCIKLSTADLPQCLSLGQDAFKACYQLSVVSMSVCSYIGQRAFSGCERLLSLYLNDVSKVTSLGASTAFISTPIGGYTAQTGGVYGSVFVPASLYSSFLTATNWSYISDRIVSVP